MFQLRFNLNRIHDSAGKPLRTADQARANSHALSFSFHPGYFISATHFVKLTFEPRRVTAEVTVNKL